MSNTNKLRLSTIAVHSGAGDKHAGYIPSVIPINPSVTYYYEDMNTLDAVFAGEHSGYVYSRYGNPTVKALEEAVSSLENGSFAMAFASGMAAIHAVLLACGARTGSTVVAAEDIYGATYALLDDLMRSQGVDTKFVDISDLHSVERLCSQLKPVVILAETISNPLLKVADIPSLSKIAHRHGAWLLVDHTFATPILTQPLELGANVVVHSTTKYLAGHGDVLGGVAISKNEEWDELYEVRKVTGANPGAQDAWLVLRGIKTLHLRVHRQCKNAKIIAQWLLKHPKVKHVYYPGLPSHPQHNLAQKLFNKQGYGGVVSFDLENADQKIVFKFFESLKLCQPATSLGDIYTLILYPAHSSHRALTAEARKRIGIGDGLVRLSLGIEAIEDIIEDLEQALNKV
jgi:cystathionine gamma-synthase/methionine-gamma-lyase